MDVDTLERLLARAERTNSHASRLVNRYIKEGLRMDEHPGIAFVTASDGARVPVIAGRPRLRLVDVLGTWRAERQDAEATARYFAIAESDVLAALRYYAAYREEMDSAIDAHLAAQDRFERLLGESPRPASGSAAPV